MSEIIEILFEDVKLENLSEMLVIIASNSIINNYQLASSTSTTEINFKSKDLLCNEISNLSDGSLYINLSRFRFDGIEIDNIGIQVYKYADKYDVSLDIEYAIIINRFTALTLKIWVDTISRKLNCKNYYCGYEPAIDEQTRFFSKYEMGPLNNWENQ